MNKSYLLALTLAAALAVPAIAQQQPSSSNPSDQNNQSQPAQTQAQPSQSDQNTQTQPSQTATAPSQNSDQQTAGASGKEPLKYERHEGFWGHLNPFARKKYVARQLDPIRGRVNELDELTAKNAKQIADVDSRATEGIRNAMSKATDADAHAVDAGNRADQANQTAQQAHTRIASVEQTVNKLDQYEPVTQAEIRFRPGQAILSKNAKEALDEMASSLKSQKGYILEVQGFSPGSGVNAIENSREMAQMVVRYLVLNHEIPVYRIYTVGMGNAPLPNSDGKLHRARGGRVEVNLMKNSLGTMASANPNAAAIQQAPSQSTNPGAAADKPATPPR
jgi:outer membrane protein OmpA-like peptidoglycan-associated protein